MNKFSKTKASPILNILGMTIAFTAFYVIMSQVMYDVTYNNSIKDADKKYMICTHFDEGWISHSPVQACNKAADAGYRVIIVLAGITENLRRQTQKRLDAEFAGRESKNSFKTFFI